MYRAVILDVDGTLVDSNDAHARAWVDALAESGRTVPFARVRPLIGMGSDKLLAAAAGIDAESPEGQAVAAARRKIFEARYIAAVRPTRGAAELVTWLRDERMTLVVANKHPQAATVERAVRARGRRVYVDYLQNIPGKTLATAYSARASAYAGVSTPLSWGEVEHGVSREAFTIETMPSRIEKVGDLWKPLRTSRGVDLSRAAEYAARQTGRGRLKGERA